MSFSAVLPIIRSASSERPCVAVTQHVDLPIPGDLDQHLGGRADLDHQFRLGVALQPGGVHLREHLPGARPASSNVRGHASSV